MRFGSVPSRLIVLTILSLVPCGASAEIGRPRSPDIEEAVATLLAKDDLAGLEALAKRYRNPREVTVEGRLRITAFHRVLQESMYDAEQTDPAYWDRQIAWADRWVDAFPKSPTAHVVRASVEANRGLSFRGSTLAKDVPDGNWQPFREHMAAAAAYLTRHRTVASQDPAFYSMLLNMGHHIEWPEGDLIALLDEGAARYPGNIQMYVVPLRYYAPRWGGSHENMDAFIRHAMTRVKERDRASLYTRLYTALQFDLVENPIGGGQLDWTLYDKGADDIIARYPGPDNLQAFASMACAARNQERTKRLLAAFHGTPDMGIWGSPDGFTFCTQYAAGKFDFIFKPNLSAPKTSN